MSHSDDIALQKAEDEAYERWLKSTPEYWSELTDDFTAKVIASEGRDRFLAHGEIEVEV